MRRMAVLVALLALCRRRAGHRARAPSLANRCVALGAGGGGYVALSGADGYARTRRRGAAAAFFLEPAGLRSDLLHDRRGVLLTPGGDRHARARSGARSGPVPRLTRRYALAAARRCRAFPEARVGSTRVGRIAGRTATGRSSATWTLHLHVVADLRAGGQVISGESFNRFGITEALGRDGDVHGPDGSLDVTGGLLRGGPPNPRHPGLAELHGLAGLRHLHPPADLLPVAQRAYMAGLRVVVAQLVEDEPLCELEQPRTSHSCDETDTIALEAERVRELQDYVDAQSGGPGEGWFRLVRTSKQARRVIERGKLAVLMGVESSNLFGCSEYMGEPQCDREDVDRGIALYRRLGIRSVFIAHWVNNAFAGAKVESGDIGTFIAAFNLQQTGRPFETGPCPEPEHGEECNMKGLTELGEYLVDELMENHMMIEVDHLSERRAAGAGNRPRRAATRSSRATPAAGACGRRRTCERLYSVGSVGVGHAGAGAGARGEDPELPPRFERGRPAVGLGTDTGGLAALPAPDAARSPAARLSVQVLRRQASLHLPAHGAAARST